MSLEIVYRTRVREWARSPDVPALFVTVASYTKELRQSSAIGTIIDKNLAYCHLKRSISVNFWAVFQIGLLISKLVESQLNSSSVLAVKSFGKGVTMKQACFSVPNSLKATNLFFINFSGSMMRLEQTNSLKRARCEQ